jgi:peptidoglycan/xylan/chitin deacetylase (PgdA/CDA1 family)
LNRLAARRLNGRRLAVLMYHRILPDALAAELHVEPAMYVAPEAFARQLEWLEQEYRVLPLGEAVGRLLAGQRLPERACALSFDDGWLDNLEFALPLLRTRQMPATIFLATERVGTRGAFWTDRLVRALPRMEEGPRRSALAEAGLPVEASASSVVATLRRWPDEERERWMFRLPRAEADERRELLDWSEVEAMSRQGVDFESHGATHAILTYVDSEQVEQELKNSLATLVERGHGRQRLLAYPAGLGDSRVGALAREAGYRAAFSGRPGLASMGRDPWAIPRVGVHSGVSGSRGEFRRVLGGFPMFGLFLRGDGEE